MLSQTTTLEKIQKHRPLTDSPILCRFRKRIRPLIVAVAGATMPLHLEFENTLSTIPGKPIIFACNHSSAEDIVMVMRATKKHSYVLLGRQRLRLADKLFFHTNGVVWVDRQNKADMSAVKGALYQQLVHGNNLIWFPEGTWNLTANQLMLPMRWGIIETARNAGAQIIPMALDYDRDKKICRAKFGAPMADQMLESNSDAIANLRDTMATLRWDLMQQSQTLTHRSQVTPDQLEAEMQRPLQEYPTLNWDYERSIIFKPRNICRPQEAFDFLNNLPLGTKNSFLARMKQEYQEQFG